MAQAPTAFRTYHMDWWNEERDIQSRDVKNCEIWEAARATSAAPFYFNRIKVDDDTYVDGGLRSNNPVIQTVIEGMYLYKDWRPAGCVVSLGTGQPPKIELDDNQGRLGDVGSLLSLLTSAVSQITSSKQADEDMKQLNRHKTLAKEYYRFNPQLWEEDDPQAKHKLIGLDNTRFMSQFKQKAADYMQLADIRKMNKACARTLGAKFHA